MNRYEGLRFEQYVASYYTNKLNSCKQRGITFSLTLAQVRRILARKRCAYSGILLSHTESGGTQKLTDLTIERIDSNKGYEDGNCIAVSYGFNGLKGQFENPTNPVGIKELKAFLKGLHKYC